MSVPAFHTTAPSRPATAGRSLSFLTPTIRAGAASGGGLQATVQLFELAESLGYDRGWLSQDGDELSAASAVTVLAAIGQRTRTVGLGAAVLPIGQESTTGLATALATLDDLTGGRVHVALSARAGRGGDLSTSATLPPDEAGHGAAPERAQVLELRRQWTRRATPEGVAASLGDRFWYAAGSPAAARWAAAQGLRLLTADLVAGDPAAHFGRAQQAVLSAYRAAAESGGRTAVARVVLPSDSADRGMRTAYATLAAAHREKPPATATEPTLYRAAPLTGSSSQIVEQLVADIAVAEADELVVLLPLALPAADRAQILHDVAAYIAPELGFGRPAGARWYADDVDGVRLDSTGRAVAGRAA